MKLYYAPGLCSLSPHIALREAGLPFELVRVDTKTHTLESGEDFYALNPKGYVPVLELDDGTRLTEGPAIVQYIADLAPQSGLAPANGTLARYRLQEMLGYINSEVHKGFSPLFNPVTPEEYKSVARANLQRRIGLLGELLTRQTWLTGEAFTVADGYFFTVLRWSRAVKVDLDAWPVLSDYIARVKARPAVHAALVAEGLAK